MRTLVDISLRHKGCSEARNIGTLVMLSAMTQNSSLAVVNSQRCMVVDDEKNPLVKCFQSKRRDQLSVRENPLGVQGL